MPEKELRTNFCSFAEDLWAPSHAIDYPIVELLLYKYRRRLMCFQLNQSIQSAGEFVTQATTKTPYVFPRFAEIVKYYANF